MEKPALEVQGNINLPHEVLEAAFNLAFFFLFFFSKQREADERTWCCPGPI